MSYSSIFKKYSNLEMALETKNLLEKHGIKVIMDDNVPPVDVTFTNDTVKHQIELRIAPEQFEKATSIMEQDIEDSVMSAASDHYLFSFSDEELYGILIKKDEWSAYDYLLAKRILKERGKSIDEEMISALRKTRLDELSQPEKSQKAFIYAGYIFALLGGFIGMIIGYMLWTSKKTLPDGKQIFNYSAKDRRQGLTLFIVSVVFFLFYVFSQVYFIGVN
ncbi:MAG: hypothetical protein ACSHWW_05590 [Nonlabens sp.]|uniref:hypothetical protein n=1 Tax=Nonlabens sp. TaxID=1888209 RepID=UPI003EF99783